MTKQASLYEELKTLAEAEVGDPLLAWFLREHLPAILSALKIQWIPVSERLPNWWTDVLIYHVLGDRDREEVPHAIDVAWLTDKNEWLFPWDRADRQRPEWVTHWMPLPPAPQSQEDRHG